MKHINKKIIIPLIIILLLSVSVFSMAKTKISNSLIHKTDVKEDLELDNWELSTVFYDSTVGNGKVPLTEINWNVDGSVTNTESRTITVLIHYKNTNAVQDYEIGDLKITVPNIGHNYYYSSISNWSGKDVTSTVNVGANDNNHSGYDWNFVGQSPSNYDANFSFTNNFVVEKNTNFEGTIQLVYDFSSNWRKPNQIIYEDSVEHSISLEANLNEEIHSNEIELNYLREYIYNWKYAHYQVNIRSNKISSYDRLGDNPEDYIWVKYGIFSTVESGIRHYLYSDYPYIRVKDFDFKIPIEDGCVVYSESGSPIDIVDSNAIINANQTSYYWANNSSDTGRSVYFYVGYPRDIYESISSTNIQTDVNMYGTYEDKNDEELLVSNSTSIKLSNFEYTPTGSAYSINKTADVYQSTDVYTDTSSDLIYQSIRDNNGRNYVTWNNTINVRYIGSPMTLVVGDDHIFVTDNNNNLEEMNDNDYYYTYIKIPKLTNSSGYTIEEGKYTIHLFVRNRGENNYTEYSSFANTEKTITFSDDEKIAAWYITIDDMKEGLSSFVIKSRMMFVKENVEENGSIYNYSYLKVLNSNNEIVNSANEDSYNTFEEKDYLLLKDMSEHQSLLQRSQAKVDWSIYVPYLSTLYSSISKSATGIKQDAENERFTGTYTLAGSLDMWQTDPNLTPKQVISEYYTDDMFYDHYDMYELLPLGINLTSSKQDIIDSIKGGTYFYDKTGEYAFSSIDESSTFFKEHVTVEIVNNWRNTGRTWVHASFDFPDKPITRIGSPKCFNSCGYESYYSLIELNLKFEISYDSYIDYGSVYDNYAYSKSTAIERDNSTKILDSGVYDSQATDINNNGNTEEKISYSKHHLVLNSIISTHQDIQVSVQSDKSNYATGRVDTSNNSNYTYKLRARTGQNDITNLVIYNSIEEYTKDSDQNFINAYGVKGHWQGEFIGVDTSYAESKGYNVKVYYSESKQPGSLDDDDTWQVYNDSVDKTKIKSLAFEYLDENNQPAVLSANSLTYVLINMKSPNEDFKTFAYNGCWTEWNAIDPITEEPVSVITGINSNIVRVALPSSVEMEDMELNLTKTWQDNSNSLNKRPETVKYYLIANGDYQKATEVTFGGTGNTWTYNISVPKYDNNGEEISYEILEDAINLEDNYKYVSSVDNYEVTNILYKNIIITKNWVDNNNAYLTRPPNITVKVYRNNTYYKDLIITGNYNESTWTGSISVPVFDRNGNEYNYKVDEISVPNYKTSCEDLTCTNTLTGNDNIVIQKEWVDSNNSYNTRPGSIVVKLKQNGENYKSLTIFSNTNGNTWSSENVTVPKYDSNGVKYTYTIEEEQVPKYGKVEYDQANYKITNTLKETKLLTITKIWKDNDNAYNTRPSNLKITVLQNGNNYQTVTLTGDTNTWQTTLEVPKYDDNQQEYKYSIKEDSNPDYQDITYSEDSLTVTNGLKKDYDLTITKIWDDNNNEYLVRPKEIKVDILRNGEDYQTITLTGTNNKWTKKITVPYYDEQNKKYEYTIKENVVIPKYGSIAYDQTSHTITNKLTEIPTVTLYFTVKTAYTDPITGELKYDEEGFNKILEKYNVKPEDEYVFTFTLQNLDTKKTYDGKLSTKGILEFNDIPYGKYEAVQGKDELFEFVDMTSLGKVLGVSFERVGNKGIITVIPTGEDIIFGAQLVNKIAAPNENPPTTIGIGKSIFLSLAILILFAFIMYVIKPQKYFAKI